jgi:hypothetical protein
VSSTLGASFIVSGLLEIIIPLGIGFYITRKFGTSWKNWFIGALMFLLSLVRIPLNAYANQVLFYGTRNSNDVHLGHVSIVTYSRYI